MANIKKFLDNILNARLGKDVRTSIHDGIEAINKESEDNIEKQQALVNENIAKQNELERKYDEQIKNIASENVQNAEIVDARMGFDTLGNVIKKKIYHFENVEEMKNCLTLVHGDVCETLGYYEANDGGNGTYKIINDNTLMEDGESIYELKNGLKASLIKRETTATFIFPKFWKEVDSCECILIQYQTLNFMFDTALGKYWDNVVEMLQDNEIEHIDYIVITHYDSDHVGNLKNLIDNGYINSETTIIMPSENKLADANTINYYKNIFFINKLTYKIPTEGEIIKINDFSLKFYNCNKEIQEELYTDYNDTSTIVLITHKDKKFLMMGDAGQKAQKRIVDENFINEKIDFYKIPHHGINSQTSSYPKLLKLIRPDFAVQTAGIETFSKGYYTTSSDITTLRQMNAKIYPCYMQDEYIKIRSNGNSINVLSGKNYELSMCPEENEFFIDINATKDNIQDGSEEHPFSEIRQAISIINNKANQEITINVADGEYGYQNEPSNSLTNRLVFSNKNNHITINGNLEDRSKVVINGTWFRNANVTLKHVSIDIDNFSGVQASYSNIILEDVLLYSKENKISDKTAISLSNSTIYLYKTRLENCKEGIAPYDNSTVVATIVDFGYIADNKYIIDNHNANIITYNLNFDDNDAKYAFENRYSNYPNPLVIYENDDNDFSKIMFELPVRMQNVKWIEIFYKNVNNKYSSTGKIYTPNWRSISLRSEKVDDKSISIFLASLDADISSADKTNIYTLKNQKRMYYDLSNSNYLTVNEGNYFHINKIVVGLKDDTISLV